MSFTCTRRAHPFRVDRVSVGNLRRRNINALTSVFEEPIRITRTSERSRVFSWFIYDHRRTTRWKRLIRTEQNQFYPAVVINRKEELRQSGDIRERKCRRGELDRTHGQQSRNNDSNPHRWRSSPLTKFSGVPAFDRKGDVGSEPSC